MPFFKSIKFRLTLWYVILVLLILLVFTALSYVMMNQNLFVRLHDPVSVIPAEVRMLIEPDGKKKIVAEPGKNIDLSYTPLLNYSLTEQALSELNFAGIYTDFLTTPVGRITVDLKDFIPKETSGGIEIWFYGRFSPDDPEVYEIEAVTQSRSNVEVAAAFQRILFAAIPLTLLLAAILGFFWVRRMLKPVEEITRAARDLKEKSLSQRIEVRTRDELGNLAAALNQSFERLQTDFEREHQFTSDASHELRAPLAVIQSQADVALNRERTGEEYRVSLETISADISKMSTFINKLLKLSRGESGKEPLNFEDVDLKVLLKDVVEDMQILGEPKDIRLSLAYIQDNLIVRGDLTKLRELIMNLLENAIRYTSEHGRVSAALARKGNEVIIEINDTGVGISAEHLPHIFEHFYRVNKTRSMAPNGSGLGLTICKQIVEMHQGKIEVESEVGKGSTFRVRLPVATFTI